jgi:putative ABC transport system permease protein
MLKNYLKITFKVLLRRKFYTFISLFGISFTMVVLMVAVSLFDHVFGAFPPETKADRTVGCFLIEQRNLKKNSRSVNNGFPGYLFLNRYVRTLKNAEKVSLHTFPKTVLSYKNGASIESYLKRTDGEFWEILDFKFLEGGPFTAQDEKNRNFVAVINDATRRKFFGDQPAVGKFIEADGQRFRVVGVVANVPLFRLTPFADIWVPISTMKTDSYRNQFMGNFMAIVLAKDRASVKRVQEEFLAMLPAVELPDPNRFPELVGVLDDLLGAYSSALFNTEDYTKDKTGRLVSWLLFFALLFMLLPTVNLININVSRILERSSEIGVRKSFGASSWTLVGQFVMENVVLTLIGGLIGFVLSFMVLRAITASGIIAYAEFHMNYRIFCAGILMALFFGLLSGVYPAWRMSRLHPVQALRGASL